MTKQKDDEKEAQRMRRVLESVPDPIDIDGMRPDITTSKLIYLLLKASKKLDKLTWVLIILTGVLVAVTIVYIVKA